MHQSVSFMVLLLAVCLFQNSDALRCWACSSDMEHSCADHFNTTDLQRRELYIRNLEVQLHECPPVSPHYPHNNNQKVVCMKKVQTTQGVTNYIRQCRYLHFEEKVGTCPPETVSSSTTIDFCEFCDHDGCNGAGSLRISFLLALLVPSAIFLLFRK